MEITLNKDGFHRKLQTFCFGKGCPLYNSFCPYFWLTIFCAIFTFIVPIFPVIHLLKWLFVGMGIVADSLADWYEKSVCTPIVNQKATKLKDDDLLMGFFNRSRWGESSGWEDYDFWYYQYFDRRKLSKFDDKKSKLFEVWKSKNPNWEAKLIELREKKKKYYLEQEAERERIRKQIEEENIVAEKRRERRQQLRQKFFTSIAKYTKWIAIPIIAIVASFILYYLCYFLYQFGIYIADHFYYDKFIYCLKVAGIIVGGLLVLFGVIWLLTKIFKSITCSAACYLCDLDWSWIKTPFRYLGMFFIGIGKVFAFLWKGLIMFKQEYCPGINWK